MIILLQVYYCRSTSGEVMRKLSDLLLYHYVNNNTL